MQVQSLTSYWYTNGTTEPKQETYPDNNFYDLAI
jgi:hypothetical protein